MNEDEVRHIIYSIQKIDSLDSNPIKEMLADISFIGILYYLSKIYNYNILLFSSLISGTISSYIIHLCNKKLKNNEKNKIINNLCIEYNFDLEDIDRIIKIYKSGNDLMEAIIELLKEKEVIIDDKNITM